MEDLSFEDMEIVEQVLADVLPCLTLRQTQCLALLLAGLTQTEAGRVLGIGQVTVRFHWEAVIRKVQVVAPQYLSGG